MKIKWDYSYYQPWSDNEWLVDEMIAMREKTLMVQNEDIESNKGDHVMNIEWDYSYYQPWSDNEWLVDEMMAMQEEALMARNKDITMQ